MEFRLNKIDPEVRRRVKETTSAGKVHNKSGIFINKDYKGQKKNSQGDFKAELTKYKQGKSKKRIFVEASKVEEVQVKAFKEDKENISTNDERGNILDVKK
ncbi:MULTISPECIES: hypothetical protein [Clostridium]|uniref:Uncharacterized protein n=2 Tax=Clostridium TaxID=1485 RepID=D8GPW5_CLOLD|nr:MULTISPECIES: hypothetical protein [Clostridium]ADK14024.1 conserved hypothetical protein [Clostridium ljungdahlii DSM 13528]AGY77254.1 hypothetical protein CAETHG_3051 [Clostridium autoethanogenum DSM 10061]ALU37396.1 Hypothetical protein CLAU_2969 [Clostridium autoethanogenum DSM 10061]OAA87515.1 hypothetical protein WX45_03635 [Clostridium ljungdahlii DSM 13528]OVY50036.1 hypothetical protein WX72_02796 [Clostridium autoethanogenum]